MPEERRNLGKRGRSTVERHESVGQNTLYRNKDVPLSIATHDANLMVKTSPHSIQGLKPRDNMSDLHIPIEKQDSGVMVTRLEDISVPGVQSNKEPMVSRNLYSQPPAFSTPLHEKREIHLHDGAL